MSAAARLRDMTAGLRPDEILAKPIPIWVSWSCAEACPRFAASRCSPLRACASICDPYGWMLRTESQRDHAVPAGVGESHRGTQADASWLKSSSTGGPSAALEHQRRIELEEHRANVLRLRPGLALANTLWVLWIILDWLVYKYVYPIDLFAFGAIRQR